MTTIRSDAAEIHRAIARLAAAGDRFALALVLSAKGSTPCKAGAKALILADGSILGTVGGGAVEAEARRIAGQAIGGGKPLVFDFGLEGAAPGADEPICGGKMRLLVDPGAATRSAAYGEAAELLESRRRGILLTSIAVDPATEVSVECLAEDDMGRWRGFLSNDFLEAALRREAALLVAGEAAAGPRREILIEPLVPKPLLLVVGAGHVGQAVTWQADRVGFQVVAIDDRAEFLTADRFPEGTATRCGPVAETIRSFPLTSGSYVVIATRNHRLDAEALAACLAEPVAYLGMIGSRRKVAQLRREFVASGSVRAETFDRVYAPIGLEIGAATVPEIATSIVAQLIAVRRLGRAARFGAGEQP